jgi:hypothetical protein
VVGVEEVAAVGEGGGVQTGGEDKGLGERPAVSSSWRAVNMSSGASIATTVICSVVGSISGAALHALRTIELRLSRPQPVVAVIPARSPAAAVRVAELDGDRPVRGEHPAELEGEVEEGVEEVGRGAFRPHFAAVAAVLAEGEERRGGDDEVDGAVGDVGDAVADVADEELDGHP